MVELLASLHARDRDIEALRHRLDLLLRRLYGPRGERFDPLQLLVFAGPAAGHDSVAAHGEPAEPTKPQRRCRPQGRRRMPEGLPREPRHHELPVAERVCRGCGRVSIDIGADKCEQLDYRPESLFVVEHFVHKYVCPSCSRRSLNGQGQQPQPGQESEPMPTQESEPQPPAPPCPLVADPGEGVIAAPKPASPIAKGLPGPGLLAYFIVSKYTDHMPLHRLERSYERQGLFLQRSNLCDWLDSCADLLRPLYNLMVSASLQSRSLHTDDTAVKMQEPVTHHLTTARLWVYLGDAAHPSNVFDFTLSHKRDGPQRLLANYRGYLHADAFSGYDGLYLPGPRTAAARIIEVAWNAHARRKFYEARGSEPLRSQQALTYYRQLYELERQGQGLQLRAAPSDAAGSGGADPGLVPPVGGGAAAGVAAQKPDGASDRLRAEQLGGAVRYTEVGFLAIYNNPAQRKMKRIAIGRRNWLTAGSRRGGQTAAVLFSFMSTCQRVGVEPWACFQDVLTRLPPIPAGQFGELLPDHWQAACRASTATPAAPATATTTPSAELAP